MREVARGFAMYMVMFVLDYPDQLDAVLDAWSSIGVSGVTIVESTGMYRRQAQRQRIHARYGLGGLAVDNEVGNLTLFVIVPDAAMAQRCLAAVEEIVGDLDALNTGVLAAWPLAIVKGVPEQPPRAREE